MNPENLWIKVSGYNSIILLIKFNNLHEINKLIPLKSGYCSLGYF